MQESLTKYLSYPIVTQLSGTTIAKIQKPYVYICEEGQFRFNHSKLLGYDSATDFLAGFLNTRSDQSSWRGKYGGGSFENISKKLYIHDYSNLRFNDFDDDGMKNLEVKMFPFGFCKTVKDYDSDRMLKIHTPERVTIHIVDSNLANDIRVLEQPDSMIETFHTAESYFAAFYYVEYEIFDDSIAQGSLCTDYLKLGSSYGKCIDSAVKTQLISWFGCLPPWVSLSSEEKCDNDTSKSHLDDNDMAEIANDLGKLVVNQDMKVMILYASRLSYFYTVTS